MPENIRYLPPQAAVMDGPTTQLPKPKGVLVLQVLAGLIALPLTWGLVRSAQTEFPEHMVWILAGSWVSYVKLSASILASVSLVFLLQWRSQFARWSGVAWLAFVMIMSSVVIRPNFSTYPAHQINEYLTFNAIAQPIFALTMFFAAFSKRARAYFSNAAAAARS